MAERVQPRVFRVASGFVAPAAMHGGMCPRVIRFAWFSGLPLPVGNTKLGSPLGQASFHSLSVFATSGGTGIVLSPDSDFGAPNFRYWSMRCRPDRRTVPAAAR